MKVSIIIPNYNGKEFIKTCLDSLKIQTYKDFEIIVVDNASQDGSDMIIESDYPEVTLVRSDKNYGFSSAVNVGMRLAKTPYIILLNNDVEAELDFVERQLEAIDGKEQVFSCSCKMIQFYNREFMDDAGDLLTITGWAFQRGVQQRIERYRTSAKVFTACAGAAIYRKEIFEEIGYFDETHFAYLEDMDIGWRAKIAGYQNIYCPDAVVYHIGSGSSGAKLSDFKASLTARNNIYLMYKNMPLLQLLINLPFLAAGCCISIYLFNKAGFAKAYVKGLKEGWKTFLRCKKVKFKLRNSHRYFLIELELIKNTVTYFMDSVRRKRDRK